MAHRPEPHQARKRGWLPIDTGAVIVAAMTTFALAYSPNQDGIPLEGLYIVDVVFGWS
ncbi:MAG: hypothetical protein KY439_10910 [Actinobacteria bacterium]|nr:hypothetical protein [Actinomycetota bacterium]